MEQCIEGTLRIWSEPFVTLRAPKIFNLRIDPFERADITSNTYGVALMPSSYSPLVPPEAETATKKVPPVAAV